MKPCLALFMVLLLAPLRAVAEADGPDYWKVHGVAENDVLNMRAEPGPHASRIMGIPPNATCLKNLGCKGGLSFQEYSSLSPAERKAAERRNPRWCKVEWGGKTGWVSGHYLQEASEDCSRPMPSDEGGQPRRSDELSGVEPIFIEGYRVDAGSERPGGDYSRDFATDAQDCARWCSREEDCKAFDYFHKDQICVLKNEVPPARLNPAVITAVKESD